MGKYVEKAEQLFLKGYNCAQAVCGAFAEPMGLSERQALRLSSGFGGGMGRMRATCGAVSGMVMVIGMLGGYDGAEDDTAKKETYALVQKLSGAFLAQHSSINCHELLKNLKPTRDATPTPRTAEFYKVRPCAVFVATAAKLLEEEFNLY